MPTQPGFCPTVRITIPPPTTVPPRPIATVSHAGIGSGPGTAKRASAPVMNADAIAAMTVPSIRPAYRRLRVHVLADARRGRGLELAQQPPRDLGNLVDR